MRTFATIAAALALVACGEQPQVANRVKQDTAVHSGTGVAAPYTATGWKPGDRNSWEQQLKTRTQAGQNDYVRVN
jgi:hypothetical protein